VATREVDRKLNALFNKLKVPPSGPAPPAVVEALTNAGVPNNLSALASFAAAYEQKKRLVTGWTLESPEAAQDLVTFEILTQAIESGLVANRPAIISKGDFSAIQLALKQQVEYANSYRIITGELPLFDPAVLDLMEAGFTALKNAIQSTPPRKRQVLVTEFFEVIGGIVAVSQSPSTGPFLGALLDELSTSGDQFRALANNSPDCDELLQALKSSTYFPFVPLPPNTHPLADGAASQLPLTGTYESTGSTGSKSFTLQLNRAGQYLLGRLQEHEPLHQSKSWELEGLMLGGESAAGVKFSCVRYSGNSGVVSTLLEVEPSVDGMNVRVTTKSDVKRNDGSGSTQTKIEVLNFERTSTRPFYSAQFSTRMANEVKAVFDASLRAPLHQDQQVRIAGHINKLQSALLQWEQFRVDAQPFLKRGLIDEIDSACTLLVNVVSRDQIPLLRQFTRSRLSGVSERPIPGSTPSMPLVERLQIVETGQKTQWTLLLELFRDRDNLIRDGQPVLPSCARLLTDEPLPETAPLYTYRCEINKSTVGVPTPLPVSVAGGGITFEIKRELNGQVQETLLLGGGFTQAGAGVPLGKISDFIGRFSGGTGGDSVIVTSPVNYTEADLSGPIVLSSAGAMATTFGVGTPTGSGDFAVSRGIGSITLMGPLGLNPSKPALVLPLPFKSSSKEIGLGAEAAVGLGGVVSMSAFEGEVDIFTARLEPLKGPPRRSFELGQQTVFNNGSSDLTDCGWVQLRQFVAEYRAIFDDPAAKITLIGLTDTVGSDAANLSLSVNRNLSTIAALNRILGREVGSEQSPVRILSLGEQPARSDLPLPTGLNPTETALLQEMRKPTVLGTLPEGSPQGVPGWRVVKVLLNNTIYFDLNAL
jgi:hypothetical protein